MPESRSLFFPKVIVDKHRDGKLLEVLIEDEAETLAGYTEKSPLKHANRVLEAMKHAVAANKGPLRPIAARPVDQETLTIAAYLLAGRAEVTRVIGQRSGGKTDPAKLDKMQDDLEALICEGASFVLEPGMDPENRKLRETVKSQVNTFGAWYREWVNYVQRRANLVMDGAMDMAAQIERTRGLGPSAPPPEARRPQKPQGGGCLGILALVLAVGVGGWWGW